MHPVVSIQKQNRLKRCLGFNRYSESATIKTFQWQICFVINSFWKNKTEIPLPMIDFKIRILCARLVVSFLSTVTIAFR